MMTWTKSNALEMNWQIAIPSYKRSDIIQSKTLAVLEKYSIPLELITIFVSDPDQYLVYRAVLPDTIQIVIGELGLAEQRNFILDWFPVGTHIFFIDDDVTGFIQLVGNGKKVMESFTEMIDTGFAEAEKANCCLWGLAPCPNPFFMKRTVTSNLMFIIGSAFGMINPGSSGDRGIHLDFSEKEDYIRSILCYERDGAVVRLNYISPVTKYYKTVGGMQSPDRLQDQKLAVDFLMNHWPTLVHLNKRRKNSEYPEILLRGPRINKEN